MKRLFSLVCLFAVFSIAFASKGSVGFSGKDVKQENVVHVTTNQEVQFLSNFEFNKAEGNFVVQFVNFNEIVKSGKITLLPDIVGNSKFIFHNSNKKENSMQSAKCTNKNSWQPNRNQDRYQFREILKC